MLNSLLPWLAITGLLPYSGLSQNVALTTDEGVPVGVPISGNYSGLYRPQVHFSPPKGFMNDPNGLFRDSNGTWHLYYQYNPTALVAGNQHWGHATSADLYHWTNQPIALFPPNSSAQVFSGSAVVDTNNTSGFFPNQTNGVVAIYTLNTPTEQTQDIAYSRDGGYNFTMYSGNPVLRVNSNQFRDPKVFWYDDHWVMVVSFAVDFTIGIYTSNNLKEWTFGSNFTHHGLLGLQYECPNLVQVPVNGSDDTAWIMAISINPGAPLGGSITQYFPGAFNGTHFEPFDRAARIADFGKDNYAGQWFYGLPSSEAVSLGWASNWQYTNVVPTGSEGWRSAMSVPRRNFLTNATRIGYVLASAPYDLSPVLGSSLGSSANLVNSSLSVDFANLTSNALYFSANISIPSNASASSGSSMNVTFTTTNSNETLALGYFFGGDNAGAIWIDRGGLKGFSNPFFTDKFSLTQVGTAYRIEGVLDRSLLEVFVDDGTFSATNDIYPTEPLTTMSVATTGIPDGSEISVGVWGLKSVWDSSST